MLENLWQNFLWLIGGGEVDAVIPVWQLMLRTIIVYIVALLLIRVAKRRFMGSYTSFDILLGFIVGSILSRAITGTIRFIDMFFVVSVLIAVHWLIATLTYYFNPFGGMIKNDTRQLITDGEIQEDAMRKSKLGENDLLQALRQKANVESPDEVESAYLERDGSITVIPKKTEPRVLDVKVENGVQTIKISLE